METVQGKSDFRIDKTLLLLLGLGLIGSACFFWKLDDVFPAASIDLRLRAEQIEERAQKSLLSTGNSDKGFIRATTFSAQDYQEIFLEHEYDVSEANTLMRSEIPVWLWSSRFCKPLSLEEFRLWLTTDGRLNSFRHTIEAERALPLMSHLEALKLAIKFAHEQAGIDLPLPENKPRADFHSGKGSEAKEVRDATSVDTGKENSYNAISHSKTDGQPEEKKPEADSKHPAEDNQPRKIENLSKVKEQSKDEKPGADVARDTKDQEKLPAGDKGLKLIIDGTAKQSRRLDHYFTWENQGKDYKGGRMRTYVYVSGNIVTEFSNSLHVPDSFERKYNHIRSYNELLSSIAEVVFACLMGALLFVFVWALSTHQVRWKLSLTFAFFAFVGTCLSTVNNWPVIMKGYETSKTFQAYLTETGIATLLGALSAALSTVVLIGGTEALYRRAFPDKLMADSFLKPISLKTRQLFQGLFAGICMFGVQLGWITFYYLVGRMCGVWSPLQMREGAVLSSLVPAYSSFSMAVEASVFEELLCRVLCLVLVQKLTKNFWIANFVQAVGWAFMHSNYPQEPAYVRGVELSFVGFTFGLLVRRFGIIPSVISHFTYNCLLGVLSLLSPNTPGLLISGLVAISPAFIWLTLSVLRVKSSGFVDETPLLNSSVAPTAARSTEPDPQLDYHCSSLGAKTRGGLFVAGAVALALSFLPLRQIGQDTRLLVTREQAVAAARQYLVSRGIADEGWQTSSYTRENLDGEEIQYGFEKEGLEKVTSIMKQARYPLIWYVRFFKPEQPVYYEVMLSPSGKPIGMDIEKPDDAPGKTVPEEEARRAVEDYLEKDRPEFLSLKLGSSSQTKRDNRIDHTFIYEAPQYRMGDARLRVTVTTVGAEVDRPFINWDIPSAWSFERRKKTFKDELATYASYGLWVAAAGAFITWLVGLLRSQSVHWRPALVVTVLYGITSLVQTVNEFPAMITRYSTDVPMASFWTQTIMGKLKDFLMFDSAMAFLAVISFAAFRLLRPKESLTAFFRKSFLPASTEERQFAKHVWLDAIIFGYTGTALMTGLDRITESARAFFSPSAPIAQFSTVSDASGVVSPAIDFTVQSLSLTLIEVLLVPVCVGLFARFFRTWPRYLIAVLVVSLINYASNRYWQNYIVDVAGVSATLIMFYFVIRHVAKGNVLSYALFAFVSLMTGKIIELAKYGGQVYPVDIGVAIAITLLPLAFGMMHILSPATKSESAGTET